MDPDEFNEAVWKQWYQYKGPTDEERVASQKFSPDRYTVVPAVCVFAEHETTTAKGEHRKYDLKELVKIVRGNNERISDVGAFPAISDGHTSNPDDPNPREPNIVGYAGNYRLGIIGRKKPRWAIFQDEYQLRDAAKTLAQKPRRSVELWTFKDGRAHFDPIAAIGAEAPRLPLPQRFTQYEYQGASVERYTFAGAYAAPAAGNTFVQSMRTMKMPKQTDKYAWGRSSANVVRPPLGTKGKGSYEQQGAGLLRAYEPSGVDEENRQLSMTGLSPVEKVPTSNAGPPIPPPKTKQTYAAEPVGTATPVTRTTGDQPMPRLAPDDIQQIIAAIAQTPQFDFLTKLVDAFKTPDALIQALQGGGAGAEAGLGGGSEMAGEGELPPEGGEGGEGGDLADLDDVLGSEPDEGAETEPEPEAEPGAGPAGPPPGEAEPEAEPEPEKRTMSKTTDGTLEKYSQLQRSHQEALKDMATMHTRIQQLERTNANHARRAKLADLHEKFPHFVDVADEAERCLYSEKANMTDAEFTKHIADVEKYAQKAQNAAVYIPTGDAPKSEEDGGSPEKYAMRQKINQRAIQIATSKRNKGEAIDYETAKELARQELAS